MDDKIGDGSERYGGRRKKEGKEKNNTITLQYSKRTLFPDLVVARKMTMVLYWPKTSSRGNTGAREPASQPVSLPQGQPIREVADGSLQQDHQYRSAWGEEMPEETWIG